MTALETAIIKTLAYADIFNQALTSEELIRYLIGYQFKPDNSLPEENAVSSVQRRGELWSLKNRDELYERKVSQQQIAFAKRQTTEKYLWIFRLLPWVKMVGITGSVAGGTPRDNDDIDLLIITQPRRLWLSRLLLILFLNLVNKRRKPSDSPQHVNDKFCLNMWLSQDDLAEKQHDLYSANEIARIIPVLNRESIYEQYIIANSWVTHYLPNFYPENALNLSSMTSPRRAWQMLDAIEHLAERMQRKIMRQPSREIVKQNRLAFHPYDYRSDILKRYRQRLRQQGQTIP